MSQLFISIQVHTFHCDRFGRLSHNSITAVHTKSMDQKYVHHDTFNDNNHTPIVSMNYSEEREVVDELDLQSERIRNLSVDATTLSMQPHNTAPSSPLLNTSKCTD